MRDRQGFLDESLLGESQHGGAWLAPPADSNLHDFALLPYLVAAASTWALAYSRSWRASCRSFSCSSSPRRADRRRPRPPFRFIGDRNAFRLPSSCLTLTILIP